MADLMASHAFSKQARRARPPMMPALPVGVRESLAAETLAPLRRDLLPACAALMPDHKARKDAGAMTRGDALERLEALFDREHAVGAVLLDAWRRPSAFVIGRVERDSGGAPVHIHVCELCVAARGRRRDAGVGARLVEFLRQHCDGAPAGFDAQEPRRQVLEWINLL